MVLLVFALDSQRYRHPLTFLRAEARGKMTEARELALETLRLRAKYKGSDDYYDSETSKPAESAVACFSWTAAVCVDLAVRYASN